LHRRLALRGHSQPCDGLRIERPDRPSTAGSRPAHLRVLSERDITDLIAFLDWVSKVDNAGWPLRPILVTDVTLSGTDRPLGCSLPCGAGSRC